MEFIDLGAFLDKNMPKSYRIAERATYDLGAGSKSFYNNQKYNIKYAPTKINYDV